MAVKKKIKKLEEKIACLERQKYSSHPKDLEKRIVLL